MTPAAVVTIDGAPASTLFASRISSVTVTDNEGVTSDTCQITLTDMPPAALPRTGAIIGIQMGYLERGLVDMGQFSAEDITAAMFPHTLTINGKAAALRGKIKDSKERHWDDASVADIVQEIAGDNGLQAAVAGKFSGKTIPYFSQQNESDLAVLERLALRYDALYTFKNQRLIFAERGSGQAVAGGSMTPMVITPSNATTGTATVSFTERYKHKAVQASYTDRATGTKEDVEVDADPEGEAVHRMGQQFATMEEAEDAAQSRANQFARAAATFNVTIIGDPTARAGAPLTFAGMRPGVDGLQFTIGSAVHALHKGAGYTTGLSGELAN